MKRAKQEQFHQPCRFFCDQLVGILGRNWPTQLWLADSLTGKHLPDSLAPININPTLEVQLSGHREHGCSYGGRYHSRRHQPGEAIFRATNASHIRQDEPHATVWGMSFRDDTLRVLTARTDAHTHWMADCYHTRHPLGGAGRDVLNALSELVESGRPSEAILPLIRSLLVLSLEHLRADEHADHGTRAQRTWRHVYQFMTEHFAEPLTREMVAHAVGLHPNYVSSLCTKTLGRSFQQTMEDIRMNHARHLLRETDLKIAAVGRACGYPTERSFIRAFKRRMGATPGRWRVQTA